MATQAVIDGLTQTIQDCLEAKLQAGFDAQAALTVDIAREVASAVESKANEYTDIEIDKVLALITGGEVDLGPFTEFMNTIKTLLDGDETTEGYQIFNTLITDTAANKNLLISHTTTIQSIQQTLVIFQNTLDNHEQRISDLEAHQDQPINCEDCHDELLNIVKGSFTEACTDAAAAQSAYNAATSATVLADWKNELDPITLEGLILEADGAANAGFNATATGRRVDSVVVTTPTGTPYVLTLGENGYEFTDADINHVNGDYVFAAKDSDLKLLKSVTVTYSMAIVSNLFEGGRYLNYNTFYSTNAQRIRSESNFSVSPYSYRYSCLDYNANRIHGIDFSVGRWRTLTVGESYKLVVSVAEFIGTNEHVQIAAFLSNSSAGSNGATFYDNSEFVTEGKINEFNISGAGEIEFTFVYNGMSHLVFGIDSNGLLGGTSNDGYTVDIDEVRLEAV